MLHSLGADVSGDIKYVYIRDNEGKLKSVKMEIDLLMCVRKVYRTNPCLVKLYVGLTTVEFFISINQALLLNLFVEIASNLVIGLPTVQMSRYVWYANLRIMLKVLQNVYGVSFSSVQQALQYTREVRCGQLDVATAIKETKNPYETKEICIQI